MSDSLPRAIQGGLQTGIGIFFLSNEEERGRIRRDLLRATWLDAWVHDTSGKEMASGPRTAYFVFSGATSELFVPLAEKRESWGSDHRGRRSASAQDGHSGAIGELHLTCPNGYRYLFLKTIHALRWLVQRRPAYLGPSHRLIFKADEDTYVCNSQLNVQLANLPSSPNIYVGQFAEHTKLRIRPGERWEDLPHYHLFNRTFYPPYAQVILPIGAQHARYSRWRICTVDRLAESSCGYFAVKSQ